jgi:toxin ParE1/3/4
VAYRLKFSGRAVREIGEAFDWYEEQSKGLGSEFELAFELQLKRLEQVPLLYTEIIPGVRRTLLPRFPYGVFYTVKNDLVSEYGAESYRGSSKSRERTIGSLSFAFGVSAGGAAS